MNGASRRHHGLRSALLIVFFYLALTLIAHTMLYTIVAYLVSVANKTGTDFGNTVNEIAGQYHFFAFALGAALMAGTTWRADRALYRHGTFWNEPHKPFWRLDRLTKEELVRGLSSGAIAALLYLALFVISGQGSFLGVYITSTFGTPVLPLFFVDLLSLATLLFCEEYIFRYKVLGQLAAEMHPATAVALTTLLYVSVKYLQFDLSGMDILNLTLMNLALGYFFVKSGKAHRGIGLVLALLCILHSGAGLPLWGNESPSFFLFKTDNRTTEALFGGMSGPFQGLALSTIFLVFTLSGVLSWRKKEEARRQNERLSRV